MVLNKEKITLFIIKLFYVLLILSFISTEINSIIENYLMFILFFINVFIFLAYNIKINRVDCMYIIPLIMIILLFSILSLSGIGSYMNLLNLILIVLVTQKIKFEKKEYKSIIVLSLILLTILCLKSAFVWKNFELNKEDTNPNVLAQSIILSFGIVYTGIKQLLNSSKEKIVLFIINIIAIVSIYLCNSRTALVAILIFTIAIVSKNIQKIIDKHFKQILCVLIMIGVVIPLLYVYMYDNNINIKIPLINKRLFTGREILWKNMMISLNETRSGYLIGLGSHNVTKIGIIKNLHNWYFGMIYLFGIPMTILYYTFLINKFKNIKNISIKISIISVFLIGNFETSALWVNSQFLIFILLLLDNYYDGEMNNVKEKK